MGQLTSQHAILVRHGSSRSCSSRDPNERLEQLSSDHMWSRNDVVPRDSGIISGTRLPFEVTLGRNGNSHGVNTRDRARIEKIELTTA
jgi:hypothetical protein